MASSPFTSAYNIQYPYQPNFTPYVKDHGAGPSLPQSSAKMNADLQIRVAVLEKELQHCYGEKAEAEIAVQYLATLNATSVMRGVKVDTPEQEIVNLKRKLQKANEEKIKLKNKLISALATLSSFKGDSTSGIKIPHAGNAHVSKVTTQCENLIDLLDSSSVSTGTSVTGDATTLLDQSDSDREASATSKEQHEAVLQEGKHRYESEDEDLLVQKSELYTPPPSLTSDLSNAPYTFRFVKGNATLKDFQAAPIMVGESQTRNPNPEPLYTAVCHTQQVGSKASEDSKDGDSSSPSPPVSASTSFDSDTSEAVAKSLKLPDTEPLHKKDMYQEPTTEPIFNRYRDLTLEDVQDPACSEMPSSQDIETACEEGDLKNGVSGWNTSRMFDSTNKRENAIELNRRNAGSTDWNFPDFFRHGLSFCPDIHDRDVYRTILISGLPPSVTMNMVLDQVRGGFVVDAKLLGTTSLIGSKSALVVFLREHAAMAYVEFSGNHPIIINKSRAHITLVDTPTWPIPLRTRKAIFDHHHTRCFQVHDMPRDITPAEVRSKLKISPSLNISRVVRMTMRDTGVLELQSSSVDAAGSASAVFTCFRRYRQCSVRFITDPCAQPLETLL